MTSWMTTTDLCRYYKRGRYEVRAVDRVSLAMEKGEFVAVVGASGSGKSTLLNLLAGLDRPTEGHIEVGGRRLDRLSRRELARYRASRVGIVFQSFNLLPHHTALKNVEMALYFDGTPRRRRREKARDILKRFGLEERLHHRPADLSGGEQQRIAVARALVKNPEILFADEPTGNLDEDNARAIMDLLVTLNREGLTVLMVTHDVATAERMANRVLRMHYGRVVDEKPQGGVGEPRAGAADEPEHGGVNGLEGGPDGSRHGEGKRA
jgi:putative ABC transport system ATP-binding protein